MSELLGVLAAMLSSATGGMSVGVTRYIAGTVDPLAIGAFRFGIGVLVLLPVAAATREQWPGRKDWPAVAVLGLLFFALFPVLFNASLTFTTAARGALALSTLPLLTLVVAAAIGAEALTARKTAGVLIATAGVALSLISGLAGAPAGAWRGDLLMVAAALSMAVYSIYSKRIIQRSGALTFTTAAMCVGAPFLTVMALVRGSFAPVGQFGAPQWSAVVFLGVAGGALTFFLWSFALRHATPTRVAISVTVNPISASLVGSALLHEPIHWNLVVGLVAVFVGIWLALTVSGGQASKPRRQST